MTKSVYRSATERKLAEYVVGAIYHEQRVRGDKQFTTDSAEWRMVAFHVDMIVDTTNGFRALPSPDDISETMVEKYRGYNVYVNMDGFFTKYYDHNLGYCQTLDEIRAEIDHDIGEYYGETTPDTPSLDTWHHDIEMDID
jgi:hypothetical protein